MDDIAEQQGRADSLAHEVAGYYAARVPEYDRSAGFENPVAEKLRCPIKARYREVFKGKNVLEVACGTGYWTAVIAKTAASVLGVDMDPGALAIARDRCRHLANVQFEVGDAYRLEGIPQGFDAALAIWWWSHMPKALVPTFITVLHQKLVPGAPVLFVDQLAYEAKRRLDTDGNLLETRTLSDGRTFEVVKNFPAKEELASALQGLADDIAYVERPEEGSWCLSYRVG